MNNIFSYRKLLPTSYFILLVFFLLATPILAFAHTPSLTDALGGPFVTCGGAASDDGRRATSGSAPCTTNELIHTVVHIVYFGIAVALYIIAPIAFAWGGIMFLISGGNEGRIGSAKKILTGTAIGVLIVLFSFLIVQTFVSVLGITGVEGL